MDQSLEIYCKEFKEYVGTGVGTCLQSPPPSQTDGPWTCFLLILGQVADGMESNSFVVVVLFTLTLVALIIVSFSCMTYVTHLKRSIATLATNEAGTRQHSVLYQNEVDIHDM